MDLPLLIGSPKQVAWAKALREQWLHSREAARYPEFKEKVSQLRSAREFIDGRDGKLFMAWQQEQDCSPSEQKAKEAVLALTQYLRDCLHRVGSPQTKACCILEGLPEQVALAEKIRHECIVRSSPELVERFFAEKQTDWWIAHQGLPLQRYAAYLFFVDQEQITQLVRRAEECLAALAARRGQEIRHQLLETKVFLLEMEKGAACLRGVQAVKIPLSAYLSENLRSVSFLLNERGDRIIVPRPLVQRVCSDKSYAVAIQDGRALLLSSGKKQRCSLAALTTFFPLLGPKEKCEPLPLPPAHEVISHVPAPLDPVLTLQIPHELTR